MKNKLDMFHETQNLEEKYAQNRPVKEMERNSMNRRRKEKAGY